MVASIPAQDLNNAKWSAYKQAQFGGFVLTQFWLMASCVVLLVALGAVGYELHLNTETIANFKPMVIRINDVGEAEAVDLRNVSYRVEVPEIRHFLADFVRKYYTRNKARIRDYYQSKYYLSGQLGALSFSADQQSDWIKKLMAGQIEGNDVIVKNPKIHNLNTLPYSATVEFIKVFYSDEQTESRREDYTASIQFVKADKVENRVAEYNPLGLTIVDLHTDQAFH